MKVVLVAEIIAVAQTKPEKNLMILKDDLREIVFLVPGFRYYNSSPTMNLA
jgi:hypothetical protein